VCPCRAGCCRRWTSLSEVERFPDAITRTRFESSFATSGQSAGSAARRGRSGAVSGTSGSRDPWGRAASGAVRQVTRLGRRRYRPRVNLAHPEPIVVRGWCPKGDAALLFQVVPLAKYLVTGDHYVAVILVMALCDFSSSWQGQVRTGRPPPFLLHCPVEAVRQDRGQAATRPTASSWSKVSQRHFPARPVVSQRHFPARPVVSQRHFSCMDQVRNP